MRYLLDTDTLSFLARGEHPALTARVMRSSPGDLAMSVISRGEAEFGLSAAPLSRDTAHRMRALLATLRCLPISEDVATDYADIRCGLQRAGTPIGHNDLWIAAQARSLGLVVVTHNTREFSRVERLQVEDWLR